ncbi:hypothetical protein Pyn_14421 [Prunus yedoensis var. nudiflora]|uniref:Uncharacterized protein n=1 Tax=Prunus yedoensis var. nudiflora TaxID=2094558 RepID=A0A314XZU3_PRUYE|nr:hypothetical protein Pyn_14421 [Prunus yedoensis var. nudiflora]
MWLGTSCPTGGLTLSQHVRTKNQDPYVYKQSYARRLPNQGSTATSRQGCPGFRHIQTISMYQYPRGGTCDVAHHVLGKTIQPGIV